MNPAMSDCRDRNGNGKIDTSRDLDGNGIITTDCNHNNIPDDLLDVTSTVPSPNPNNVGPCVAGEMQEFFGLDDECVLFTTNTGAPGGTGRPLTLGPGSNGDTTIQQIQNDMAPGMALSRLALDVRSEAIKGVGFVGDVKNPPKYHDVAHLTVVGVAQNDTQIAQMIGKLSANPLFADVSLNYMHKEVLREYQVRRFEIQMTMDLDRLSVESPGAAEGKSHE
jgi:hypothetical protein